MNKKIMLACLLALSVSFLSSSALASFEHKDHMMAALFVSENPVSIRLAAKILEDETNPNIALTDLAALILYRNYQVDDEVTTDANAWILKALKPSANKRYLSLLSLIGENTDNEKLEKYLDETISSLTRGSDVDPSVITGMDYEALKGQLEQSLATEPFSYGHIDSVKKGETVEAIYQKLGYPTDVGYYIYSKRIPFVGSVKLQDAKLYYAGSGSVHLRSMEGAQLAFQNVPERGAAIPSERLADELKVAKGQRAVIIAKELKANKDYGIDLLDVAADKVWSERNADDRYMIDAIAHLCEFIGASRMARYADFVEQIVNTVENKKIVKYAKKNLKLLTEGDGIDSYQAQ